MESDSDRFEISLTEVTVMISKEALQAARAAYDIEAACINEMKEYIDDEQFSRAVELLSDATSCAMCRRLVINAGLKRVIIRKTKEEFEIVDVQEWIDNDDSVGMPEESGCSCCK